MIRSLSIMCAMAAATGAQAQALYGYVPMPASDSDGQPVSSTSGQRVEDGFCIFWRPGWQTEVDSRTAGRPAWWLGLRYTIYPNDRKVAVHHVIGPDVAADPNGGWHRVTDRLVVLHIKQGPSLSADLFEAPDPAWPCSQQTWRMLEAQDYSHASAGPVGGFSPNSDSRPSVVNPCLTVSGHRVPGCH